MDILPVAIISRVPDVQLSTEMRRGQDLRGKHGILLTPDNWSILIEPYL